MNPEMETGRKKDNPAPRHWIYAESEETDASWTALCQGVEVDE
jgi:hypothetical protein